MEGEGKRDGSGFTAPSPVTEGDCWPNLRIPKDEDLVASTEEMAKRLLGIELSLPHMEAADQELVRRLVGELRHIHRTYLSAPHEPDAKRSAAAAFSPSSAARSKKSKGASGAAVMQDGGEDDFIVGDTSEEEEEEDDDDENNEDDEGEEEEEEEQSDYECDPDWFADATEWSKHRAPRGRAHHKPRRKRRAPVAPLSVERDCKCKPGQCTDQLAESELLCLQVQFSELCQSERRRLCQAMLSTCLTRPPSQLSSVPPRKSRAKHKDGQAPGQATKHRPRVDYRLLGARVCKHMFSKVLRCGKTMLTNCMNNLGRAKVVADPTKQGTNRIGATHPQTALAVAYLMSRASLDGLQNPSQRGPRVLLPAGISRKSVYQDYRTLYDSVPKERGLTQPVMGLANFVHRVWRVHVPWLKADKHRTDLCERCIQLTHQTWDDDDDEDQDDEREAKLVELHKHLLAARVEREFYHAHARFSVHHQDTVALAMDKAGAVRLPHLLREGQKLYYTSGLRVDVVGIANLHTMQQRNYVVSELNRPQRMGADFMISLLHHALEEYKDAKRIYLLLDNARVHKCRAMLWYMAARATLYQQDIVLHFLVPGHTKSPNDAHFGVFKRAFKRQKVCTPRQFIDVINAAGGHNSAVDASTVPQLAFQRKLEPAVMVDVHDHSKRHHFWFSPRHPGTVRMRTSAREAWGVMNMIFDPADITVSLFQDIPPLPRHQLTAQRCAQLEEVRRAGLQTEPRHVQQEFLPMLRTTPEQAQPRSPPVPAPPPPPPSATAAPTTAPPPPPQHIPEAVQLPRALPPASPPLPLPPPPHPPTQAPTPVSVPATAARDQQPSELHQAPTNYFDRPVDVHSWAFPLSSTVYDPVVRRHRPAMKRHAPHTPYAPHTPHTQPHTQPHPPPQIIDPQ